MNIVDRIRLLTVVAGAMFLTGLVFVADAKNFIVERDRGCTGVAGRRRLGERFVSLSRSTVRPLSSSLDRYPSSVVTPPRTVQTMIR
jgi:hypothetical protein